MERSGQCPICKLWFDNLTKHHIWRRAVWGRGKENDESIMICETCHNALEKKITEKENYFLKQHPEIYSGTLEEFLSGKHSSHIALRQTNIIKNSKTRTEARKMIKIVIKEYGKEKNKKA